MLLFYGARRSARGCDSQEFRVRGLVFTPQVEGLVVSGLGVWGLGFGRLHSDMPSQARGTRSVNVNSETTCVFGVQLLLKGPFSGQWYVRPLLIRTLSQILRHGIGHQRLRHRAAIRTFMTSLMSQSRKACRIPK